LLARRSLGEGGGPGAWAKASTNNLLSTLFEPPCAGCRQRLLHPLGGAVCDNCWTALRLSPPLVDQLRAGDGVDWSCAVDRYEGRMKEIIHALKYEHRRSIAPPLGELMRTAGARILKDADAVVPVPLHPRREFQRGFNQADDIARHLGLPVAALLVRVKHTRSQIELPKEERQQNVNEAFAPNPRSLIPGPRSLTSGPRSLIPDPRSLIPDPCVVVLVDDVATTGATLDECARVLKRSGVKEVRALTAARVVHERR
jgi:predicted amidophosphoribosyltransferase